MLFRKIILLTFLGFLTLVRSYAQNIAPTLSATGNQAYCPLSQINIVTDFDIVDPDDTGIDALFVQISTGYQSGEDTLLLTGTHPNIATSWNTLEGKLTLDGVVPGLVSYTDLIAAVKDIVFQSTSTNPLDKSFSITIGDANYLPSTDHYYEYVPALGITWTDAKVAAEARTYFGLIGYLATITSPEEAQLSGEQAAGAGWIGGSDAETEGVWKWVTGPEDGTIFWNGSINGTTPNYANWNTAEPNQAGDEDYAHVTAPSIGIAGSWNDLSNTGSPSGSYQPKGYIVEYGGMPGDPTLNISASTNVFTAHIVDSKGNSRCGDGTLALEATPSAGATVLWYDSVNGGSQVGSGNSFTTPTINATTTYYAYASINGCLEGDRTPVVAEVITIPNILSVNDNIVCGSGSGILTVTASAGDINWYDSLTGGTLLFTGNSFTTPVLSDTTTYYVDATFNGCTTLSRTSVTLTVQKTTAPTANTLQTFCDIEDASISDLVATGDAIQWYATNTGGTPLAIAEKLTNTTYYASQTVNNCESVSRIAINVEIYETVEALQPIAIPSLYECDTDADGDDTNGFSTFDLTLNETILLNGKSAADFTFSYFTDATRNTSILTPSKAFDNTVKDGQTIYVRISNNNDSNCYTDVAFNIEVNALPEVQPVIVFKNCDEDGNPDGNTNFNLNEANEVITNNNSSVLTITYHLSIGDADTGADAVNAALFNNATANTVYARIENSNNCHRVSTVNLEISATSFPQNSDVTLEFCDDDDTIDGFHVFDLTQATVSFLNNLPAGQNLSVHYFRNLSDAQLEQNEITSQTSYINEEEFDQVLYVRIESEDNGDCFGIGPHLALKVNPRPEFEVDQSETFCLDNNPITLRTFNPKGNYTYEWRDKNDDVVSNSPNATVVTGGTYTVVATSTFGCDSFPVLFTVIESAEATIDMDDLTIVELSDNNSITINNENNNLGIGDYEFALDDEFGTYRDEPFFDRVGAGQHTLYVRDKKGCGTVVLDVFILGFPKFFSPNNDGYNDTWEIKGLGTDFSNTSVVNVYDRYGKLMKQLNAKNGKWDGTFNGSKLPSSDYWFVAQLIDQTGSTRIYRGHFSLIY